MAEKTVENYIGDLEGWQAQVTAQLDRIIMEVEPKASKVIKWAQPTYESDGLLCYFKAFKTHINFGFFRGSELDDPKGILEGTGDKMRHVKLKYQQELDENALKALIISAAKLNRSR